jgi:membrane-bound lytic murein transglycosylase D
VAELANIELSENMFLDITEINYDTEVSYSLSSEVVKKRLAKLDARSPFNIEYNPALENTIKPF